LRINNLEDNIAFSRQQQTEACSPV